MPKEFSTQYENTCDDGAPYGGPVLLADSWADAETLLLWVRGPNGEPLTLIGEIVERIDACGDTRTIIRRQP